MKTIYTKIIWILFSLLLISGFATQSYARDGGSVRLGDSRGSEMENENDDDNGTDRWHESDNRGKRLKKSDEDRLNNVIDNFNIQKRWDFLLRLLDRIATLKANVSASNMEPTRKASYLAALEEIRVIVKAKYDALVTTVPNTIPPSITLFQVISPTSSWVTLSLTSNEAWVWYYVILPSWSLLPTVAQVRDWLNASWTTASIKGNFNLLSWSNTVNITWLSPNVVYTLYFVAKDNVGNFTTSVYSTSFTTTTTSDGIPPVISSFFISWITRTGATLTLTTNEVWKVYYIWAPMSFSAPSAAQVKEWKYATWDFASVRWNKDLVVWVNTVDITSLAPNTIYVLYFTQEDTSWNLWTSVKSITFITSF